MSILSKIEIHAVLEIFCFSLNAIDSDKIFHNHEKGNRYNPLCPAWIIVRTLYPPLRFPVLPQFIISLLEFHCLPANTTRPNKNVYCFSSTVTTFLLFPSSTIITFLLFSSGATRFLLFSFYHHYHHNSTVFPLSPPQFCCFPRPHHLQIYCFPAPSTTPFPPQFYYFSSSTTTTTTFPFLFSFFTTTTIWVESIFLKDLALEQFPPENRSPLLSNFLAGTVKYSRFFLYLPIENPSGLALEEN